MAVTISQALNDALAKANPPDSDAAAVALARRYAALLDDAAPLDRYREPLRRIAAALDPDDATAADAFNKIRAALSEHSTASDLGPKLLAALTALGMTAAGRGVKGGTSAPAATSVAGKLDDLRARRERRARSDGA